ncbi:MAG: DUF2786 domain-containing protein [Rhodospirillaceae bacterium]
MTTDALDKLKARLQALRAKTIANGCTEEEALSAAAKVAELLDRHDLSISDLDIAAEPCVRLAVEPNKKQRQAMAACVGAIAEYCDCKVWREKDPKGAVRHVFFGLPASAEMARALHELIDSALQTGWQTHVNTQRFIRHAQDEKTAFLFGMAVSVAEKLIAMKADRDAAARSGGGRDLVVVRHAVVDTAFSKLDLSLREGQPSGKKLAAGAFDAGRSAGTSVSLPGS